MKSGKTEVDHGKYMAALTRTRQDITTFRKA